MEKLREFCKENNLHIIAEEKLGSSILAVNQSIGCFVVVEDRLVRTYPVKGGLRVRHLLSGEVSIETLPVKTMLNHRAHRAH